MKDKYLIYAIGVLAGVFTAAALGVVENKVIVYVAFLFVTLFMAWLLSREKPKFAVTKIDDTHSVVKQSIFMSERRAIEGQERYAWSSLAMEVGQMVMNEIGPGGKAFVEVEHSTTKSGLDVEFRIQAEVEKVGKKG